MYTFLRLQQFRSYQDYVLELDGGVNIIVGPNASGKTNLLEGLYMVAVGRVFRGPTKSVVQQGKDWARIDGGLGKDNRTIKFQPPARPKLFINEKSVDIKTNIYPIVLFEPDNLRLISGSPQRRRDYLDQVLSTTNLEYLDNLKRYNRALEQRNKLLKSNQPSSDELFVWDIKLAEYGSKIIAWREELAKIINRKINSFYSEIAGKKQKVEIEYKTNASRDQSKFLKLLHSRHSLDKARQFTTIGPHRDDLEVYLNGFEASDRASRGEARSLVVTLKMIEIDLVEKAFKMKPVVLLDDVFSELDSARRQHLTRKLKNYQTLITTTDADAVIEHFSSGEYKIVAMG